MEDIDMLEKPCPFCGTKNLYIVEVRDGDDYIPGIFCNLCKVTLFHEDDSMELSEHFRRKELLQKVKNVWNHRAEDK